MKEAWQRLFIKHAGKYIAVSGDVSSADLQVFEGVSKSEVQLHAAANGAVTACFARTATTVGTQIPRLPMKMKMRNLMLAGSVFLLGCPPPPTQQIQAIGTSMTSSSTLAALQTGTAVAIVFDTSGSMAGDKLAIAKRAFAEVICPRLAASKERVEYSLIGCGGSAYVIQPNILLETSPVNAVNSLSASGGTPLGESIMEAYQQLSMSHCDRKYIFILSDGAPTGIAPQDIIGPMKSQGVDVGIYVVGFQSDQANYQPIADLGGHVLMADDATSLGITCDTIFRQILKCEAE